jgi:hypothetical protein
MKIYIYFNNITKLPAFLSEIKINSPLAFKEICLEDLEITDGEFNLARYKWEGDFDSGKLVDLFKEKRTLVTEEEIDGKYYAMFFRKYSLEKTLFNIIQTLYKPASEFPEGTSMYKFLEKLLDKKDKEIEFYKTSENHRFETHEEQQKHLLDSFKV